MKLDCIIVMVALSLASASGFAFAGDKEAGKTLYKASCVFCHGENGVNPGPQYPNLAGQKIDYLIAQLKDFRSKVRPGTVMPMMAEKLTDAQIGDLSTYLSSLTCQPVAE